jgi:hypothetical protein
MKKIVPALLGCFFTTVSFAQDVRLNDSVIFINNSPTALYSKQLSNSPPRYNMEVYSFSNYVLIKAEIVKFDAPVDELRPFYYYELTFPPAEDTFAVYIEDEAFPLVLAKMIRDYKLISNDQLDMNGVKRLKAHYPGGPALIAKIKEVQDYLDETRFLFDQVIRDRTKPVRIINEKTIMQDSIKIGYIDNMNLNLQVANRSLQIQQLATQSDYNKTIADACIIYMENGRIASKYGEGFPSHIGKRERGYDLYQSSKSKNVVPGSVQDLLLLRICILIAEFYM